MDTDNPQTIEAFHRIVTAGNAPTVSLGGAYQSLAVKPFYLVPDGYKLEDIEKFLIRPIAKRGSAVFFALDSFGRYVNEHKNADTRIFAVVANGQHQIVAILDFHGSAPAWGNHTARFTPEFSRQWRLWSEINGNPMLQSAFINFIERNIVDVKNPTAAAMLELLEYVEAKQDARFENKLAVTDGKTKVLFEEDLTVATGRTTKTGMFELPRSLTTSFPVLKGAAAEELPWRLRPSVQNRQLMFTLDLPHAAQLVDQRHFDLLAQVKELTGIEPFAGAFAKG